MWLRVSAIIRFNDLMNVMMLSPSGQREQWRRSSHTRGHNARGVRVLHCRMLVSTYFAKTTTCDWLLSLCRIEGRVL